MSAYLGIDIAKAAFEVCLEREGQRAQCGTFANTPRGFGQLQRWLGRHKVQTLHACMEATGTYGEALAEYLYTAGYQVSVVNPAQIHAYAQSQLLRNKTDRLDAALIAHFCRTQNPYMWQPPSPAWRELQALVRHLEDLQAMLTQEKNRLGQAARSALVQADLQAHVVFLQTQIEQVKRHLHTHLNAHPDLKEQKDLLVSIPGIADLTAAKLIAEIPDLNRFDSAEQLVAYAGLNPQQRQSGKSNASHTPFSKIGNAALRTALYFPALSAKRFNPHMVDLAARLSAAGKAKMVVIGAIMRKLLVLVYAVLKSKRPFDPHFRQRNP